MSAIKNNDESSQYDHSLSGSPSVRLPVFVASVIGVLVMATWAIAAPQQAESVIGTAVGYVVDWFGWFYILLTTAVLVFVLYLAISRYGAIKLGPDHSQPEFSTFAWASMLFAAGIGTDVMFFAVAEPVSQYMIPPTGAAESIAAARDATVWTLFHYGISGWGLYALMGMALGYFTYRANLPLAVRSALYPIFGRRIDGVLGHTVDTAAVLGTIFGVATSLGIGVVDAGDDKQLPYVELRTLSEEQPFIYRVQVSESPVPGYGGRMVGDRDVYARLEVHSGDGGQDYDVMGYSGAQLIHDCLDQYERHLEFLRLG